MLGVFLQRERFEGLGNDFASASPASIDARMARCFSGPILFVERRADADFYVIAAPKERHTTLLRRIRRKPSAISGRQTWDFAQMICEILSVPSAGARFCLQTGMMSCRPASVVR